MDTYSEKYFDRQQDGSRRSAEVVVPLVAELVDARSIVDVGCGVGAWLSVWFERGLRDILGIDGDYIERSQLRIPSGQFQASDLTRPLHVGRQFDLVMCLEVAEHLPAS